ncbi:27784_t:CDS:1, partial [Dentiscutata erythropus]
GDKDAPAWPFRIVMAGASNSDKTNINLNLLTMPKFYYMFKKKKHSKIGERNVKFDDVFLFGHHLNEPKYKIVQDFYKYLAQDKSKPYYED